MANEAIDMAAAQARFDEASSNMKRAKSRLVAAEDSYDNSVLEYTEAHEAFRTASRSVIAGNR